MNRFAVSRQRCRIIRRTQNNTCSIGIKRCSYRNSRHSSQQEEEV